MVREADIKKAVDVLKKGGVIVFPTETAYGLAADATNSKAVRRVFEVKERAMGKNPPLIVSSFAMAERYVDMHPKLWALAQKHWPGPLSIKAPVKKGAKFAKEVVRREGTVTLRYTSGKVAAALARRLKKPIVATSANRSKMPTCFDIETVKDQLRIEPDFYLDGGKLKPGAVSTIIREKRGKIVVLREGKIKRKALGIRH